jgi:hypothetical protein
MGQESAVSQIMLIEQVWGIRFTNREELATWVREAIHDDRQILVVTSSINNLIAMKHAKGSLGTEVRITRTEFQRIVRDIKW